MLEVTYSLKYTGYYRKPPSDLRTEGIPSKLLLIDA